MVERDPNKRIKMEDICQQKWVAQASTLRAGPVILWWPAEIRILKNGICLMSVDVSLDVSPDVPEQAFERCLMHAGRACRLLDAQRAVCRRQHAAEAQAGGHYGLSGHHRLPELLHSEVWPCSTSSGACSAPQ